MLIVMHKLLELDNYTRARGFVHYTNGLLLK